MYSLFTTDVIAAKEEILTSDKLNTQKAHWLMNIGDYNMVYQRLAKGDVKDAEKYEIDGLIFRLGRHKGVDNPYQLVLNMDKKSKENTKIRALKSGIICTGGIGDHIEEIAKLISWYKENGKTMIVEMSTLRAKQLKRLLGDTNLVIRQDRNDQRVQASWLIGALDQKHINPVSYLNGSISTKSKQTSKKILCCWVASGSGDKLSKWIRSVPINIVYYFYKQLVEEGVKPSSIVDISEWKSWEKKILKHLGIELIEASQGDVMDVANIARRSETIITIDTALAHIAVAMNREVEVLLPKHPDERWVNLLSVKNSYSHNCKMSYQEQYGCWEAVIERLIKKTITH